MKRVPKQSKKAKEAEESKQAEKEAEEAAQLEAQQAQMVAQKGSTEDKEEEVNNNSSSDEDEGSDEGDTGDESAEEKEATREELLKIAKLWKAQERKKAVSDKLKLAEQTKKKPRKRKDSSKSPKRPAKMARSTPVRSSRPVLYEGLVKLTNQNYVTWSTEVREYMFSIGAQDMLRLSQLKDGKEQTGRSNKVAEDQRTEVWFALRRSLSPDQKITFDTEEGEVKDLLRAIRRNFYKADNPTVALLMNEVGTMTVSQFPTVQHYISEMKIAFRRLSEIGKDHDEGLQIFYITKGLPSPDYDLFNEIHGDKEIMKTSRGR